MNKKICALALALVLSLAGCAQDDVSDQQFDIETQRPPSVSSEVQKEIEPVTEVRLAYNANDFLNPYTMTSSINRQLVPLLYDSLTRCDKSFQPQNLLATEVVPEGNNCIVKFNRRAQFSDGTLLTGTDIVYSINTALASATWRPLLDNITYATVNADGDVLIQLRRPDADLASVLSFPIIKDGSAAADYPTGVSRFYFSGTWGTTGGILTANHLYYGDAGTIKQIKLVHVADPESLPFSLKSGEIDLVYSDLSGVGSGAVSPSAMSAPITLNRLVYLGVNAGRGLLSRAEFREAVSTALNRDELVSKAYVTHANATKYPLNPAFYRMREMELSVPRNLTAADALLDGLGLTEKDADGYRLQYGKPITFSLLVNSENTYRNAAATLIAEQLGQIGIKINVVSQTFAQYQTSVTSHSFDFYIGETRLMENMDVSSLMGGGSMAYGAAYSEELATLYNAYKASGEGISAFCAAFTKQSPFVPLVFRQGVVTFNREFRAEVVATEQNIFYNIAEW